MLLYLYCSNESNMCRKNLGVEIFFLIALEISGVARNLLWRGLCPIKKNSN